MFETTFRNLGLSRDKKEHQLKQVLTKLNVFDCVMFSLINRRALWIEVAITGTADYV